MLRVELRIKGRIHPAWSEWFNGLTIEDCQGSSTQLSGQVPDEAALYGIIARLRDLGLQLVSLSTEEVEEECRRRG
jgi:hypothetical protein